MTTTITPSLGHGILDTQAGIGTTPGYDAIDRRRSFHGFQRGEGVWTYPSWLVVQRGAGANMSVDIGMDESALVRGDAVTLQGLYTVAPHSATINEAITTSDPTNPRVDRVILELQDNTHDASGQNRAQTRVVAGTPSAGATLDNLTGAAAVPSSAMLLADVLVGAGVTSITNANIRDRRPFQAAIPPLLTDVDMVAFVPPPVLEVHQAGSVVTITHALNDLFQAAALMWLPRRIVAATRIRWRYQQGNTNAMVGNYVLGIYDASGRKIIDTGAVAWAGAADTFQSASVTITATTFEPGAYYVLFGNDSSQGTARYNGVRTEVVLTQALGAFTPNMALRSTTGGTTAPTTILGFTDVNGAGAANGLTVPIVALSVG